MNEQEGSNEHDSVHTRNMDEEEQLDVEGILARGEGMVVAAPDYTAANSLPFALLCNYFERLSAMENATIDERLHYLFPRNLLWRLNGEDPYPFLRLAIPQIDTSRGNTGMWQRDEIATAWSTALGLANESREHQMLFDDSHLMLAPTVAGNLSMAVKEVVQERVSAPPSRTTIGQVNDWLDELVDINEGRLQQPGRSTTQMRAKWVIRLLEIPLSPLEHKWIVLILLQEVVTTIGVGPLSILNYLSPFAEELFFTNDSLRLVCAALSDPNCVRRLMEREVERMRAEFDDNGIAQFQAMNLDED